MRSEHKIIGISGKRESGKSSLANALSEFGFVRVSLANPLKEMCKRDYGLSDEQVYGTMKETPTQFHRTDGSMYTPRDILIREGCLKRSVDPLFWCKKLHEHINCLNRNGHSLFVIDDIRFLNEVNYFKSLGAKFVRLERDENAVGKAALDDLSETELDSFKDWDGLLLSTFNRNLNDLKEFARWIVENL